jgi:hypothetical protein
MEDIDMEDIDPEDYESEAASVAEDLSGRLIWFVSQFKQPFNYEEMKGGWDTVHVFVDQHLSFAAGPERSIEGYLSDCAFCYESMQEHMKDIPGLSLGEEENMHCIYRKIAEEELGRPISFDEIFQMLSDKLNSLGFVRLTWEA